MPIYQSIQTEKYTLLVWKITEELSVLENIFLSQYAINRLSAMKSEEQKKRFLSVRHLLKHLELSDTDLIYNHFGKPYLKNGNCISISHSYNFACIIISHFSVGIDIEKIRSKTERVQSKFVGTEASFLCKGEEVFKNLTTLWSTKEAVYKAYGVKGLPLKEGIKVEDFITSQPYYAQAKFAEHSAKRYLCQCSSFEEFVLVWCLEE